MGLRRFFHVLLGQQLPFRETVIRHYTVYRRNEKAVLVIYLSSQTGCDQGCRMCHLTATGQTRLRDTTFAKFLDQADTVLDYYRRKARPARSVHFQWM